MPFDTKFFLYYVKVTLCSLPFSLAAPACLPQPLFLMRSRPRIGFQIGCTEPDRPGNALKLAVILFGSWPVDSSLVEWSVVKTDPDPLPVCRAT